MMAEGWSELSVVNGYILHPVGEAREACVALRIYITQALQNGTVKNWTSFLFIHSFIYVFLQPFIHRVCIIYFFIFLFIPSAIYSSSYFHYLFIIIYSFSHWFIHSFSLFIYIFIYLFNHSFIFSFTLFIYVFIYSFSHLFTHPFGYLCIYAYISLFFLYLIIYLSIYSASVIKIYEMYTDLTNHCVHIY